MSKIDLSKFLQPLLKHYLQIVQQTSSSIHVHVVVVIIVVVVIVIIIVVVVVIVDVIINVQNHIENHKQEVQQTRKNIILKKKVLDYFVIFYSLKLYFFTLIT